MLSCKKQDKAEKARLLTIRKNQTELIRLLKNSEIDLKSRYAIINQMANNFLIAGNNQELILFLTDWVERNPDDIYNSYWLLMTAFAYMSSGSEAVAEYYFDRILQDYKDLLVQEKSVHFICLQNLIRISKTPENRIRYFNDLINRFPDNVSVTELYLRLALEYEKVNEWNDALKSYELFLKQPDSPSIQIAEEANAYKKANQIVEFSKSSKNWTFDSLESLETTVRKAIQNYDWRTLDKIKAKVNFFSMSWKQDEMDPNAQEEFSMRSFMRGNRVRCAKELDSSSNSNEAYLRTWGWSQYVSVWYFYFRKVNFPSDPDIHGNWEWAGIYIGEKL